MIRYKIRKHLNDDLGQEFYEILSLLKANDEETKLLGLGLLNDEKFYRISSCNGYYTFCESLKRFEEYKGIYSIDNFIWSIEEILKTGYYNILL